MPHDGSDWYYKLECGHIRLLNKKKGIKEGETEVYCVKCDDFVVVKERSESR